MLIKSIIYFLGLFVTTFLIVQGANSEGFIIIEWFGYYIQVNIIFAIALVLLFVLFVQVLMHLMTSLGFLPGIAKRKKENKRLTEGLEKLKQVSLNLSLGNKAEAVKIAKVAQKALPQYPIFDELLDLKSKKDVSNQIIDLKMAKLKIEEFLNNFNEEKALRIVQNILKQHPTSAWAKKKHYQILLKMNEFEMAENILDDLLKLKLIDKQQFKMEKSFLNYEIAMLESDNLSALKITEVGLKHQPNFINLLELSCDILIKLEQTDKALKLVLDQAKNFNQGMAVFDLFNRLIEKLDPSEQVKWLEKLAKLDSGAVISIIANAKKLVLEEHPHEALDYILNQDLTFKEPCLFAAQIYKQIEHFDESVAMLERANALNYIEHNDLLAEYNDWKNNMFFDNNVPDQVGQSVKNSLLLK